MPRWRAYLADATLLRRVIAGGIAFCAILIRSASTVIWQQRQKAIQQAQAFAKPYATLLGEHTRQSMESARLAL